jgi:uncharacterized membrane protein YoaK (UPF0700 family)
MIRFDRSHQLLAVGVAILAGFVDAIGFVESGGFFVSFMTGNSTRLAVGVAEWLPVAQFAGGIIAVFVAGVVAGSLVGGRARAARTSATLFVVTILLGLAAALRWLAADLSGIFCLAFAMGVANAAIVGRDGAVVGVTYMTGTLVQMGHKIANRLRGEGDARWLHHFGLWVSLVCGAIAGARTILWSEPVAYGLAILLAALLALRAGWLQRQAA